MSMTMRRVEALAVAEPCWMIACGAVFCARAGGAASAAAVAPSERQHLAPVKDEWGEDASGRSGKVVTLRTGAGQVRWAVTLYLSAIGAAK